MSVAIAIDIGSPMSQLDTVRRTLGSIMSNIGSDEYKMIIALASSANNSIKDYISSLKGHVHIELMPEKDYFWADFINEAIDRAEGFKYFIKSHDDIELLTPGFLSRVQHTLSTLQEPVGWVSFTDKDYLNGHWAPSTRPGFHKDSIFEDGWKRRKLFQFHTLPENWFKPPIPVYLEYIIESAIRHRLGISLRSLPVRSKKYYSGLPYDFPRSPVKCHAPFNHFVLIEMDKLKKIGKCDNWQTYNALLVDEDWGLRALELGLNNIWVPDIEYIHYRPGGGTRSWNQILKDQERVHRLFFEKWGFHAESGVGELPVIKERYRHTNIPWSIDRNSYDWDYVK